MSAQVEREFRSPVSKLVSFFHRSRDNWKRKCQETKRKLWKTRERLEKARQRRDYWKAVAKQAIAAQAVAPCAAAAAKRTSREPVATCRADATGGRRPQ